MARHTTHCGTKFLTSTTLAEENVWLSTICLLTRNGWSQTWPAAHVGGKPCTFVPVGVHPGLKPFPEAGTRNKHICHQLCGSGKTVSDRPRTQGSHETFQAVAEVPLNVCSQRGACLPHPHASPPTPPLTLGICSAPSSEQTWSEGSNHAG